MICSDFLAGSIQGFLKFLPGEQKHDFLEQFNGVGFVRPIGPKHPLLRLDSEAYRQLCRRVLHREAGDAKTVVV
jgi:hypothetical protein